MDKKFFTPRLPSNTLNIDELFDHKVCAAGIPELTQTVLLEMGFHEFSADELLAVPLATKIEEDKKTTLYAYLLFPKGLESYDGTTGPASALNQREGFSLEYTPLRGVKITSLDVQQETTYSADPQITVSYRGIQGNVCRFLNEDAYATLLSHIKISNFLSAGVHSPAVKHFVIREKEDGISIFHAGFAVVSRAGKKFLESHDLAFNEPNIRFLSDQGIRHMNAARALQMRASTMHITYASLVPSDQTPGQPGIMPMIRATGPARF